MKSGRVAAATVKPTREPSPTAHAMSDDVEPSVKESVGGNVAGEGVSESAGLRSAPSVGTNALIGEVTKS